MEIIFLHYIYAIPFGVKRVQHKYEVHELSANELTTIETSDYLNRIYKSSFCSVSSNK